MPLTIQIRNYYDKMKPSTSEIDEWSFGIYESKLKSNNRMMEGEENHIFDTGNW
jgi:hypothetical protein